MPATTGATGTIRLTGTGTQQTLTGDREKDETMSLKRCLYYLFACQLGLLSACGITSRDIEEALRIRVEVSQSEVDTWFKQHKLQVRPGGWLEIPGYGTPVWESVALQAKLVAQTGKLIQGKYYVGVLHVRGGGQWVYPSKEAGGTSRVDPFLIDANFGIMPTGTELAPNGKMYLYDTGRFYRIGNAKWSKPSDPFAEPTTGVKRGRLEIRQRVQEWLDAMSKKFDPAYSGKKLMGTFAVSSADDIWFLAREL